jgi:hypothetical protein
MIEKLVNKVYRRASSKKCTLSACLELDVYTEATERGSVAGGDARNRGFTFSICCCIPLQPLFSYVSKLKGLSIAKSITTSIRVNRIARRLDGNIGKHARGCSGSCRGGGPWVYFLRSY